MQVPAVRRLRAPRRSGPNSRAEPRARIFLRPHLKISLALIGASQYTALCNARIGREVRLSATRPASSCRRNLTLAFLRKAAPMFKSRIAVAALIAATVTGCNKTTPPISEARPVRTVTVEQGAEGEIVSLTGQVRAKDEVGPRFSPRRTDDRAARSCGRQARRRPGRRPARSADPAECAALGGGQPCVDGGGADPGAPHFRAAAGTLEGRVDHPRQFRRGPAEAPDRPGPGRFCGGAGADRAGAAELHGLVSRRRWSGHRRRRGAGRGRSRRADGCAARA